MPRDESWLNVNQIVRLVTLPRLPNDVAVLVVLFFFLKFLLLALRRFANKRGTYITASFFFHFLVRREKNLGALLSAFLPMRGLPPRGVFRAHFHTAAVLRSTAWATALPPPLPREEGEG